MSNRFFDTSLFDKEWFMLLHPAEKSAYIYILSKCDNVGVWSPNYILGNLQVGCQIEWEKLPEKCNNNIVILENKKWWIKDFCDFQYGELDENSISKPIISYIKLLKKHDLWELYNSKKDKNKGHTKGMDTLKEKDKDKDKEKEKETKEIIDYLNLKANKKFSYKNDNYNKTISGRLSQGFTVDDFKKVIDLKCIDKYFIQNPKYLNPDTLFCPKNFEKYLNEKPCLINNGVDALQEQTDKLLNKYEQVKRQVIEENKLKRSGVTGEL